MALALAACGGRTAAELPEIFSLNDNGGLRIERCNGLDDDRDGKVDETFRNDDGRYVDDDHCGSCEQSCDAPIDNATDTACMLIGDNPVCGAVGCNEGFELTHGARCAPTDDFVCLPCLRDQDCGPVASARCVSIGSENRCTRSCEQTCPSGYLCVGGDHCEPEVGSCRCPLDDPTPFSFACEVRPSCIGRAECRAGTTTTCEAGEERCGDQDDDCDGTLDEGFVDARGAYSLDLHNCGVCGHDCTLDGAAAVPLTCGGDPFAPTCVVACADAADGIQVGDMLDADRDIKNGCECSVRSLNDSTGSPLDDDDTLDENCDGADGSVVNSIYVSTTGDDTGPGSPTRPLATIDEAVRRAQGTLSAAEERLDIYVAGGVYTETIHMADGVRLHGGYRTDYLARDTDGYEVIVVAPAVSSVDDPPGGAALVARDVGFLPTLIEGMELRGRDAIEDGEPAIGVALIRPGKALTLRDVRVHAGRPAAGRSGDDGNAGSGPTSTPQNGAPPRASIEDSSTHTCISSVANTTFGGNGGGNTCGGIDTSGGNGGSALCPIFAAEAQMGGSGNGPGSTFGGRGGTDLQGPIEGGPSCSQTVCCGLADFTVPGDSFLALPGEPGSDGFDGSAGGACLDSSGTFDREGNWLRGTEAGFGTPGSPGTGGGGGGAGGGAVINFFDVLCAFPDGLGGSGGGGGAGGCGGFGGNPGQSGGPSIAVLVRLGDFNQLPVVEDCELHTQDGGDGGDGGNGGDGGPGGSGAFGGRLPDAERTTPPLAGPSGGGRGGKGGDGGPGGGGGGGCGGNSVGVWIAGTGGATLDPSPFAGGNSFVLGDAGGFGLGGGGPIPAENGAAGQRLAVLIQ